MAGTKRERRASPRWPVAFDVDYSVEGTYLFASITDISSCGIFVRTESPLPQGTLLRLRFAPALAEHAQPFELEGEVVWITLAPDRAGMGVRFRSVSPGDHRRLLELVRAIAYLDELSAN